MKKPTLRNPEAAAANVPLPKGAASSSSGPITATVIDDFIRGAAMTMAASAPPLRHQPVIPDPVLTDEIALLYGYFCVVGGGGGWLLPQTPDDVTPENNWIYKRIPAYVNMNLPEAEFRRAVTLQEISDAEGSQREKMVIDLGSKVQNKFMSILAPLPLKTPKAPSHR